MKRQVCFLLDSETGDVTRIGGKRATKKRRGKRRSKAKRGGKKRRGKRRPMSPAQKKAFVARMKKARNKRR